MYKLDFEKVEEPDIKLDPEILWLKEKARELKKKKNLLLLHWLHKNLWLCGSKQTVE